MLPISEATIRYCLLSCYHFHKKPSHRAIVVVFSGCFFFIPPLHYFRWIADCVRSCVKVWQHKAEFPVDVPCFFSSP